VAAVRFGVSVPCLSASAGTLIEMAWTAEVHGWDGFFVWDHMLFDADDMVPIVDPWVVLGAVAATTQRIRLGTLVTPLARRRPWKVARETVTLDRLSDGRAILGVGLGWPSDADFGTFGDVTDETVRGAMLDEALDVVAGLWSAAPFRFRGDHYTVRECTFMPGPVQRPRIPVWVGGTFPLTAPLRRAARWDGAVPIKFDADGAPTTMSPGDVAFVATTTSRDRRRDVPFDIVVSGQTAADEPLPRSAVLEYEGAGATWWLETTDGLPGWEEELSARIEAGP
jgi:alkanesulfonate monooxygenase SsuD/methylene tetrahydromethanopterin reductase-like flavin-dependent oxidoreductase (luciferase family)